MSKWKDKTIKIIQMFESDNSFIGLLGLGDDSKVYQWCQDSGAWKKYWYSEEDKPE